MSTLTSVLSSVTAYVCAWDVQTGVVTINIDTDSFNNIDIDFFDKLVFSRDCRTITLLDRNGVFNTFDGVNGTYIWGGRLPASTKFLPDAHEVYEESFRVFTSSESDGKLSVRILEFRPTSIFEFHVVESFTVSPYDGEISFSHVSFHASFTTEIGVLILDLRDSRTLLQDAGPAHSFYTPPGHFSPDGCFFACGTREGKICIWKNSSASYVPWSTLRPRLPFTGFSFSPTTSSILAWGEDGVQLLEPGNNPAVPSPDKLERRQQGGNHLVAYSADGMHIATVRRGDGVVTVLDTLSNTPRLSFDTNMWILDIKIVGDVIFVADGHKLVSWCLETGEPAHGDETAAIAASASAPDPYLVLSDDCSHIAFADIRTGHLYDKKKIFLYNVQTQRILCSHTTQGRVEDIRFSLDGRHLWFAIENFGYTSLVKLEMGEDGEFVGVTEEHGGDTDSEARLSWISLFSSHTWRCWRRSWWDPFEWVADSGGNKLLWLPLSWRVKELRDARWNGNFLAFVGSDHPDPIVIEFQP